jgi:citrate lyase beta subunit
LSLSSLQAARALRRRSTATYLHLGASLYMPALRKDLLAILNGQALHQVRSVVVCTEDAIQEQALSKALTHLADVLPHLGRHGPLRFIRPRNPETLATILSLAGIERLDGVCLPKFDETNCENYLQLLAAHPQLVLMPIIETDIAFCPMRLQRLRTHLDPLRHRILCIRIGGNDLLQLLGMKRPKMLTAYDTPLRRVIDDFIVTFRPYGYELSAPVYEHLDQPEILAREAAIDSAHGLFAKTAIHPQQIAIIEQYYTVPEAEAQMAHQILDPQAQAVFRVNGQMAEPATHRRWAQRTLEQMAVYGTSLETDLDCEHLSPYRF